jgi:signal transduction histidine kinase
MVRTIGQVVRAAIFPLAGLLAFYRPPTEGTALAVQIAGYCLIGLTLLAWQLLQSVPRLGRYESRLLPTVFCVMAAAAGFAAAAAYGSGQNGHHGNDILIVFAFVAALGVAQYCSLRAAITVGIVGLLAIATGRVIYGGGYLGTLLSLEITVVAGVLIGRNVGLYRLQAAQANALLAQHQQLEAERRRADVLDERARVAREIHDVLAHSLGALSIQLQAVSAALTDDGDTEQALEALDRARRMASEGLTETRRAVHALRTDTRPLDEELGRLAERHRASHPAAVTVDVGGVVRALPPDVSVALLRTAQEGLVNAAKHAPGQPVRVRLDYEPDQVRLAIVNPVREGDRAAAVRPGIEGGYGLTGMQERLRLLGGTLSARSSQGSWMVMAEVPLAAAR